MTIMTNEPTLENYNYKLKTERYSNNKHEIIVEYKK